MTSSKVRIWTRLELTIGFTFGLAVAALYWQLGPEASPWAYLGTFVVAWAVGAEGATQSRARQRQVYRD